MSSAGKGMASTLEALEHVAGLQRFQPAHARNPYENTRRIDLVFRACAENRYEVSRFCEIRTIFQNFRNAPPEWVPRRCCNQKSSQPRGPEQNSGLQNAEMDARNTGNNMSR